ncbi:MAG: TIGR04372 family glycosyltransferase [Planctomycetes bacterium]|nr:TIGR04372 family glycosyltransferase [Planctomycetota bacterium]
MFFHKYIAGSHLAWLFLSANILVTLKALCRPSRTSIRVLRQVAIRCLLAAHAWLLLRGKIRVTRVVRLCLSSGVTRATLERNLEAAVALAEWDIGRQKFDRAEALMTRHIDTNPNHPRAAKCFGLRSLTHIWRGNQNETIHDLTRCAALRPSYARGFNFLANLSQIHGIRGEVTEARDAMAKQCKVRRDEDPSEYLTRILLDRTDRYLTNIPTKDTVGVMFGAYHQAFGHAILDPFHFYNLFRHRFDHLVILHPGLLDYSRASSHMIAVMQQHLDQIGVLPGDLNYFPWQNLGELTAGRITFLCHNYWSLNRMAYHARRDPYHPMSIGRRYVKLPPKLVDRAELVCRKNKLDTSRPVVVLHARSHGYHKLQVQSFRNVDVRNYIPAVRRLIDLGYNVVRIGDKEMTSIRDDVPGVLELPSLACYDHSLDAYFLSRCKFMMSCQSGPCSLARALGKPNLVLNAVYHHTMLPEVDEMFVFKQYRDATGSALSLEELLERRCHLFDRSSHFTDAGISLEEANADEILAATEEMLSSLETSHREDTDSQAAFRNLMLRYAATAPNTHPLASKMTDYIGYALPEARVSDAVCEMRPGYVSASRRKVRVA